MSQQDPRFIGGNKVNFLACAIRSQVTSITWVLYYVSFWFFYAQNSTTPLIRQPLGTISPKVTDFKVLYMGPPFCGLLGLFVLYI
jgi:hypothetical protein